MRTLSILVLAIAGTSLAAFCVTGQTANRGTARRYEITHLDGQRALMLDTETGAVWQYVFGDYCRDKTSPYDVRQIDAGESCKNGEDSFSQIPEFDRVSVEGSYQTPIKAMIEASFQQQVRRPAKKPMQNLEPH